MTWQKIKIFLKDNFFKFMVWVLGVIAAAIIGWFVLKPLSWLDNSDISDKYIAVVMSGTDPTFTIPKEFKQGFGDNPKFELTNNPQNIIIEKEEDLYSVVQAKIVADKLVKDENCVLIIGNSNSELTEITLNSILDSDSRPAFILPIATADGIIAKAKAEGYQSILRMMPDNLNQAQVIKRFIFSEIGKQARIAVLVDEENQAYSKNLSKNFASEVIKEDGNIVLQKHYGNNNRFINDYETLKKNKIIPQVIVYVGVSSNGMILIEELKALELEIPVIFSDGCTVEELMKKAKQLKNGAYFLSAVNKSDDALEPTYEPIGKDAYNLAALILNTIEGSITRQSVSEHIKNERDKIILNSGFSGNYEFDPDGNNKKMNFKVYTYQNGELTLVKGIR